MKTSKQRSILLIASIILLSSIAACVDLPRDNPGDREGDSYDSGNAANSFSSFSFTAAANALSLADDVQGVIERNNVYVNVPYGTLIKSLVPSFTYRGKSIDIKGVAQESGLTANNFDNPVTYTITAHDGTQQDITVTVSETIITSFELVDTDAAGTINQSAKTISIIVLYGTDISSLVAEFDAGAPVTVDGVTQTSGLSTMDFSAGPKTYIVTGSNGVSRDYTVTVSFKDVTVSHLAGSVGGPGWVDGSSSEARFNKPSGITSDGMNYYVTDRENHVIRKINAVGDVTTFAGTPGVKGSTDGPGSSARFERPEGITTDGTSLFVTETNVSRLRKIDIASRVVSTYAIDTGGWPRGIVTDGTNLYFVSVFSHLIKKVVISSGVVSTIAGGTGTGSNDNTEGLLAKFYFPWALTIDPVLQNLYVADGYNESIRKVSLTSPHLVSTVKIGLGFQPAGISTDGNNLYMVMRNQVIKRCGMDGSSLTIIAGAEGTTGAQNGIPSLARFNFWNGTDNLDYNFHSGIITDGMNLYFTDSMNNTIRKFSMGHNMISNLSGMAMENGTTDGIGAQARFYLPSYIYRDGDYLYVTDTGNNAVRKITLSTGVVTTFCSTGLSGPTGIVKAGEYIFVSSYAGRIYKLDMDTGENLESLVWLPNPNDSGNTSKGLMLWGMATDGTTIYAAVNHAEGTEYINTFNIQKVDIATKSVSTFAGSEGSTGQSGSLVDGPCTSARFYGPNDIVLLNGNLYIGDKYNGIRKINISSSTVSTPFKTRSKGGTFQYFSNPQGIASDGTNLFVTDNFYHTVLKINIGAQTESFTTLAGSASVIGSEDGPGSAARFWAPMGISVHGNKLYVADYSNNAIRMLAP